MKKFKFGLILTLLFISCQDQDEVLNDEIEDLNYNTEDLSNGYIISATIINVPPYFWDNGSSPDLQLKLDIFDDSKDELKYITNRVDNVEKVPQLLSFSEKIRITDEYWELQLIDYDLIGDDDIIYRIMFNPYTHAEDGVIPIYGINGLLVMEFNYKID